MNTKNKIRSHGDAKARRNGCCFASLRLCASALIFFDMAASAEISLSVSSDPLSVNNGGEYAITQNLGVTAGNNLFHAFHTFNIGQGETAVFSGAAHIENVISRVTGGSPSHINGTLQNKIPEADTYLINPAGIVFGEQAQLDVQGGFHAGTADYLEFSDGTALHADETKTSSFSVSSPRNFGFLDTPADLRLSGSDLRVPAGKTLRLAGGDMTLAHGKLDANGGNLVLRGRDIRITGSGLENRNAGARNAGRVEIHAENLRLEQDTWIDTGTQGSGQGAAVRLEVGGDLLASGENTLIRAHVEDSGDAGEIRLAAENIRFREGAKISSHTDGSGDAAHIHLEAGDTVQLVNENSDGTYYTEFETLTASEQPDAGNGGSVSIRAQHLDMQAWTSIFMVTSGAGDGGNIRIETDSLHMEEASMVSLARGGTGKAGAMDLMVRDDFDMQQSIFYNFALVGSGNGGDFSLEAENITLDAGSFIFLYAFGAGDTGDMHINARDTLLLTGVHVSGDPQSDGTASSIASGSSARRIGIPAGNAGDIYLDAGRLILREGANISTNTDARTDRKSGRGGNIYIQVAGQADFSGVNPYGENLAGFGSGIYARNIGVNDNTGATGSISLQADTLSLSDGAMIVSSTDNQSDGGQIDIQVRDTFRIRGTADALAPREPLSTQKTFLQDFQPLEYNQAASGVYAHSQDSSVDSGAAGRIHISAGELRLTDGATISTSSAGGGNAGNIHLNVGQLHLDRGARILSESRLANRFQFDSEAARDARLVGFGDRVEVQDMGSGKAGYFVRTGEILRRSMVPVFSVPDLSALEQLSQQYEIAKGQIITVQNAGNGEAARYLYAYSTKSLPQWVRMADQVSVAFDNPGQLEQIDQLQYNHGIPLPYADGTLIRVADMGDGKPADFVYLGVYEESAGWTVSMVFRVDQFQVADVAELNQLSAQTALRDLSVATLADAAGEAFVYLDEAWIELKPPLQVADVAAMNRLPLAKSGDIAEVTQGRDRIYTGREWIPLGRSYRIADLSARDALPAQAGDLANVVNIDTGHYESFFFHAGQWLPRIHGGDAGHITLRTDKNIHLGADSHLSTDSLSAGGGEIDIHGAGLLQLEHGRITTSVREGAGNGGDLNISAEFLVQDHAPVIARAVEGNGGNIAIETKGIYRFSPAGASPIDASSQFGVSGEVELDTPEEGLSSGVFIVQGRFLQDNRLALEQCAPVTSLEELSTYQEDITSQGQPRHSGWYHF